MALSRQADRGRVTRTHCDIPSQANASVRTRGSLGVRGRRRRGVRGAEVSRCEHPGSSGDEALGIEAVHRGGPRWQRLLFPSWMTEDLASPRSVEIDRLDDQLRRALEGEAWHGPAVLELLAGVSAAQAASHPISGAHSIWELVLHIASDYDLVLRRLSGDGRELTAAEDWTVCPASTEENWRHTVEERERLSEKLRRAVRVFPVERLDDRLVPESP